MAICLESYLATHPSSGCSSNLCAAARQSRGQQSEDKLSRTYCHNIRTMAGAAARASHTPRHSVSGRDKRFERLGATLNSCLRSAARARARTETQRTNLLQRGVRGRVVADHRPDDSAARHMNGAGVHRARAGQAHARQALPAPSPQLSAVSGAPRAGTGLPARFFGTFVALNCGRRSLVAVACRARQGREPLSHPRYPSARGEQIAPASTHRSPPRPAPTLSV